MTLHKTIHLAHYFLLALAVVLPLAGQEFRATISGVVTDPDGAAIVGAKVTLQEIHTGTKVQTVTDEAGQYTAPFLQPGDYDISVHMTGFKESIRKAVNVGSGDHPAIDVRLAVGDVTQTVEVTAEAPLLNTENASAGQSITTKEVEDLPLNGRTPMMLAQLAEGVIATGQPSLIHPFDNGGAAGWSIGGSPSQSSELLINGAPNATWDGRLSYSPPQDAVQEVRVKAFDADAAFGHTGGGTINQVMKTGTNSLHGSLYEFTQPSNLTANNYFNNKAGLGNPLTHYNQYGLSAGGPVIVPKVLDGRNRLFWFFAWENLRDSQPATNFATVPTDAEKQGNFSQILTTDGTQLYDPYSAVQNGSTITRTPFPGNQIPQADFNPIAANYLKFYGEPDVAPTRADGYDNFGSNATKKDGFDNELGRLDWNMSTRSRLFFDARHNNLLQSKNDYFGNLSTGQTLLRENWGATLDEVYTFNPTNVLDLRLNYTRMYEANSEPSAGYNPSQVGFPSYIAGVSDHLQLPYVVFSSNSAFQNFSDGSASQIPSQSVQLYGSWVKIKGNHTLKFGADLRQYRLNTISYAYSSGYFSFAGNSWVRASSSASSTTVLGQDMASFLLGLPYSGQLDLNTYGSFYSYYGAGFVQDDWRVKSNLTINVGLRYEHDGPYNEKYGRTVNGFDSTAANPLGTSAIAAYAKNPLTQLPAQDFAVDGGLTFASPNSRAIYQNTSHLASPRVGFAWTPEKLHGKTVVRGAFGMFVSPITLTFLQPGGSFQGSPILDQEGFSQTTSMVVTQNNYLTPATTLSNPFPNGFLRPAGSSAGLATFEGQNISFLNPLMKSPYALRWNFGIQHTLSRDLMVEASYIGNHSVHLPVDATQLNGIPRQYLSTLPVRDSSVGYLSNSVSNPFAGLATTQNGSTVSTAQVLSRYPEFPIGYSSSAWSGSNGVIEQNLDIGSSYFDSLNLRLQKRLSHGLLVTTNYIYSRLIEQTTWLNDTDLEPEKRVSPFDHTHRFVTGVSYALPFGKGRPVNLQSRWSNVVFGGWNLNGIYTWQMGAPISWVNGSSNTPGDYVYFGGPLGLNNRETNTTAFNTALFDTKSGDAFQYHVRTFSTTFPNLRQDGINQWDQSLLKRFDIREKAYFQLRVEAFNLLNHPTFSAPNTTANSSGFGTITSQSNRTRTLQLGGRLVF
jgi:hypothetical protein